MSRTARILVVEDERHLAAGLKLNLEMEGHQVEIAPTGREATRLLAGPEPFDLVVLDVALPDTDGFTICRRLREAGILTPVLMLTARSEVADRVKGLEAGADDYLVKPFDLDELLARVASQLRRRTWERQAAHDPERSRYRFGQAEVDFESHEAWMRGQPVELTHLEMELLRYFASHPRRVISRQELLEKVWGLKSYPHTRTVDNFVLRLRRRFEPDPRRPVHFLSVRGAGYKFDPEGNG